MIFNSFDYFLLLLPTSLLFRFLPSLFRPWILSFAGALFFIYFSLTTIGGIPGAWCLILILWQSFCCLFLCRKGSPVCLLVILQSILILCVFKYLNFLGGLIWGSPDHSPFYWKQAFLPLGISFFTFEFIHYAVDIYKGKIERAHIGEFLAFILFFPTMVAGPIKRIQDFTPKINNPSKDTVTDFRRGITRILCGLVRKFAIADLLTSVTDHLNRNDIASASGRWVLLFWIFAYGWKIYFDFSAYSDIAIGSARLFGIKVPENFASPYTKSNITEFWRHWHISLSRWLTDYVFIPLGGSRVAPVLIYRNLIIVMLTSGLWHGAGTNFILWGLWHAVLLCIHRLWTSIRPTPIEQTNPAYLTRIAGWFLTYVCVNLGWIFFAMDLPTALIFIRRLIQG